MLLEDFGRRGIEETRAAWLGGVGESDWFLSITPESGNVSLHLPLLPGQKLSGRSCGGFHGVLHRGNREAVLV